MSDTSKLLGFFLLTNVFRTLVKYLKEEIINEYYIEKIVFKVLMCLIHNF